MTDRIRVRDLLLVAKCGMAGLISGGMVCIFCNLWYWWIDTMEGTIPLMVYGIEG